ncbi:hypothetical protein CBER1_07212 [Cercospora berteroae]|uniref:Enoyl reductase (ER) domain-containing protein n=1 Tax=Cercospora berteroae TaxID=357750 RepID=A0A2S6CMB3_9PEZI|nr:hypothetical protein CBER1_07212 [Cercospora berteroae]
MATMRAMDIKNGTGPASSLFINPSIPKPTPKSTECLVKIKAFGLNRADTVQREGGYPAPPGASKILGLEFSGVVEGVGVEAGKGKEDWRVGDEVFGLVYGGAYAEFVVVDGRMLVWMTALQALRLVGEYSPEKVKSILWHAGASAVSIAGIQQSLQLDSMIRVYATTRQDAKCEYVVKEIGAHAAVNATKSYAKADGSGGGTWADEVKRLNGGKGVDLVIDYVGAPYFAANLDVLAVDGRAVMLGLLGGTVLDEKTDIRAFLMKRATVVGSTLRSRDWEYQGKLRDLFVEEGLPKLVSGVYQSAIDKVLSWKDIQEAHEMLEGNKTKGKLVCVVDEILVLEVRDSGRHTVVWSCHSARHSRQRMRSDAGRTLEHVSHQAILVTAALPSKCLPCVQCVLSSSSESNPPPVVVSEGGMFLGRLGSASGGYVYERSDAASTAHVRVVVAAAKTRPGKMHALLTCVDYRGRGVLTQLDVPPPALHRVTPRRRNGKAGSAAHCEHQEKFCVARVCTCARR